MVGRGVTGRTTATHHRSEDTIKKALLLTVSLAAFACGSASPSEKACTDLAEVTAKAAQRCGQDYKQNYDVFVSVAAGGSCANVKKVRDETALRSVCIPSLTNISCAALLAGKIDASCAGQLLRTASQPINRTLAPASYAEFSAEE
jgi:hypothetical protein